MSPGAKAPEFGCPVIVRAEARTYLRSKGEGKRRSRSLRDDKQNGKGNGKGSGKYRGPSAARFALRSG